MTMTTKLTHDPMLRTHLCAVWQMDHHLASSVAAARWAIRAAYWPHDPPSLTDEAIWELCQLAQDMED